MKLVVLMDPLHRLNPKKDTSIAFIKRAQELGWNCFYVTPNDLSCRDGQAFANISSIKVTDVNARDWVQTKSMGEMSLSEFDILLMRKDPPFDIEYIYLTYFLDIVEKAGVLVANQPQSLRDVNEKWFTLHFPQCCPKTLVTKDMTRLREFWRQHQHVIYKPLNAMGGQSVFHVDDRGQNLSVILEGLTQHQTVSIMAQTYIPEIMTTGDKRILLINGEPVAYALARIPVNGDSRGNLAAGAIGKVVEINRRDRWLCSQIAQELQDRGLYFVGVDVIGDYITEINVTSPTCVVEISKESGLDIAGDYLRFLENKRSMM